MILPGWFSFALIAMCCYSAVVLTLKKLTYTALTPVILFYMFGVMCVFFFTQNIMQTNALRISWSSLGFILLAALFASIGTMSEVESLRLAPNVGYAAAIKSGQILVVALLGFFIFKDQHLSWQGALGVLLIMSGVILLALQK